MNAEHFGGFAPVDAALLNPRAELMSSVKHGGIVGNAPTFVNRQVENSCAPLPTSSVILVNSSMASGLKATVIMRENVRSLLSARKESQADLAKWLRHDRSWINKFLNGERQMQMKDLDRVADFFGIATYQLFQPGISALTERRKRDRRVGRERRIGHTMRELELLRTAADPLHRSMRSEKTESSGSNKKVPGGSQRSPAIKVEDAGPLPSATRLAHIAATLAKLTEELTQTATPPPPDGPLSGTGTEPPDNR